MAKDCPKHGDFAPNAFCIACKRDEWRERWRSEALEAMRSEEVRWGIVRCLSEKDEIRLTAEQLWELAEEILAAQHIHRNSFWRHARLRGHWRVTAVGKFVTLKPTIPGLGIKRIPVKEFQESEEWSAV
jgi:hypothetical protein